jgi:hypothetical protein
VRTGRREGRISFSLGCRFNSIKVPGVARPYSLSLIKGFSPYFDFFGRDKVGYFGLDRSTWKEKRIDTARPPIYQKKGKGGPVCLNNRNNREFGNEKRKRDTHF